MWVTSATFAISSTLRPCPSAKLFPSSSRRRKGLSSPPDSRLAQAQPFRAFGHFGRTTPCSPVGLAGWFDLDLACGIMKVFLSWSGEVSHKVALALRDWLPNVLHYVKPYVSSEDIPRGALWLENIRLQLRESEYGIVCVTDQNMEAPWLLFEAGALSNALTNQVTPLVFFGADMPDVGSNPLGAFQATVLSESKMLNLILSINRRHSSPLGENLVERYFVKWWPDLARSIDVVVDELDTTVARRASDVADEVVGKLYSQHALLEKLEAIIAKLLPGPGSSGVNDALTAAVSQQFASLHEL